MFGNIGPEEIILILVVLLVVFGPGRIPELGGALGKGIRQFKRSVRGEEESAPPQAPPVVAPPQQAVAISPPPPQQVAAPPSRPAAEARPDASAANGAAAHADAADGSA
jgi:sec-independent protein translocase protein TatA